MTAGWVIYFIVGAIICILFCYALLWIESGEVTLDFVSLIWGIDNDSLGIVRVGYFLVGIGVIPCFLFTGYLTGARINGDEKLLEGKRFTRLWSLLGAVLVVGFFIAAVVVY